MKENYIRFDWAIKRLLRQKANFGILEGFLSELLNDDIKIECLLESKSNQEDESDKFNRVDLLARNQKQELIIVEVQNTRELAYFQRMLYGVSKVISEYIYLGDQYKEVRKVYSINIVYFDLGQGSDYIYHGYTHFRGVHTNDELLLSKKQQSTFARIQAGDIFPEYFVIRVDEFNQKAVTPLDEWILYLKTGNISDKPTARGLAQALETLKMDRMTPEDKARYIRHIENLRIQWDVLNTAKEEGRDEGKQEGREEGRLEGIQEGREEGRVEERLGIARKMKANGIDTQLIAQVTGLSIETIEKL